MGPGHRQVVAQVASSQNLVVEETQRRDLDGDRMRLDLLFEPVELIFADVFDAELSGERWKWSANLQIAAT